MFLGLGAADRVAPCSQRSDGWADAEADHWARADIARLAAIRADRAAAALSIISPFTLIIGMRSAPSMLAEAEVEDAILTALGGRPVGRLVDIGTGTGRMIALLGARAESATGIDRSPEMLRVARACLAEAGLDRADLRQGDMYALPLLSGTADLVVLHQVLHYAQQPAAAVAEAGRLLGEDGRLLIVDFAAHDREELRTVDNHVRLGFDDGQIAGWFAAAGLAGASVVALDGGELTVKLWLARRPATNHNPAEPLLKAVVNEQSHLLPDGRGRAARWTRRCSPISRAISPCPSSSSRPRRRRWRRCCGTRSARWPRSAPLRLPSPMARAARRANAPIPPSPASPARRTFPPPPTSPAWMRHGRRSMRSRGNIGRRACAISLRSGATPARGRALRQPSRRL